jgi:hypothetical protein
MAAVSISVDVLSFLSVLSTSFFVLTGSLEDAAPSVLHCLRLSSLSCSLTRRGKTETHRRCFTLHRTERCYGFGRKNDNTTRERENDRPRDEREKEERRVSVEGRSWERESVSSK